MRKFKLKQLSKMSNMSLILTSSVLLMSNTVVAKDNIVDLGKTVVHGKKDGTSEPLTTFVPKNSTSSTKTNTPITEVPQTINVIGRPQIDSTGADSLMSSLRYTSGVTVGNNDSDVWESVYIRGFKARRGFKDGMKYQVDAYDGKQESFNIERVEVSKGASSFAFAGNTAGGTVNTISKRPTNEPLKEVAVSLGTYDEKALTVDVSDSLTTDGSSKFRIVGLIKDKASHVDHVSSERYFLAPSLAFDFGENTKLTILSELQKDNGTPLEESFPRDAYFNDKKVDNFKKIDRSIFLGEPSVDKYESQKFSIGYELEHSFNDSFSLKSKARYLYVEPKIIWTRREGLVDANTVERGRIGINERTSKLFTADNFVNTQFNIGDVENDVIVGFDFSTDEADALSKQTNISNGNLNIKKPVYGQFKKLATEVKSNSRIEKRQQLGFYAQDQLRFNNLTLTLGGRYGTYKFDNKYLLKKRQNENVDETVEAFTGRFGATYQFDMGLAPFVGYSESFNYDEGGQDRFGNRFKPLRGEQIEVGTRYQPNKNMLLSAVAYQLVKKNVTSVDTVNKDFRAQTGEITTKGFELEGQAKVNDDLSFVASFAKQKARVTKTHRRGKKGDPRGGRNYIPETQASIWADYKLSALSLPNLTLGIGVRNVGEAIRSDTSQNIPAYTVIDAALGYRYKNWGFKLDLKNLTDDDAISCAYECAYGTPLSATATVKYKF